MNFKTTKTLNSAYMILGILKESGTENRVAMLPGEVAVLKKMGIEVLVELHARRKSFCI